MTSNIEQGLLRLERFAKAPYSPSYSQDNYLVLCSQVNNLATLINIEINELPKDKAETYRQQLRERCQLFGCNAVHTRFMPPPAAEIIEVGYDPTSRTEQPVDAPISISSSRFEALPEGLKEMVLRTFVSLKTEKVKHFFEQLVAPKIVSTHLEFKPETPSAPPYEAYLALKEREIQEHEAHLAQETERLDAEWEKI